MLPQRHRMRRGEDFTRAVRSGTRGGGRLLVVHLLLPPAPVGDPGPTPAPAARVGLVVSRAVGSAVQRNLVKRRVRHLARDLVTELPDGALLVIRALPPSSSATHAELRDDLTRSLGVARRRQRGGPRPPRADGARS